MTLSTPSTITRTITTRTICTSEHSSTPLVVFPVLMMCHDPLGSISLSLSSSRHVAHVSLSLIFAYLHFYFNLSFLVFFHSSVLMHPDLHTDLDNLDSVEHNLRHSAKRSNDAYDVTVSLTGYEPNDTVSSSTPRVPSPTLPRHRTKTKMTLRSASCSPKHTENTPITAVWKVCLSVSRHCLSRPIERGNPWERATSISLVLVSETRTVLTISFLQSPNLKNGR